MILFGDEMGRLPDGMIRENHPRVVFDVRVKKRNRVGHVRRLPRRVLLKVERHQITAAANILFEILEVLFENLVLVVGDNAHSNNIELEEILEGEMGIVFQKGRLYLDGVPGRRFDGGISTSPLDESDMKRLGERIRRPCQTKSPQEITFPDHKNLPLHPAPATS